MRYYWWDYGVEDESFRCEGCGCEWEGEGFGRAEGDRVAGASSEFCTLFHTPQSLIWCSCNSVTMLMLMLNDLCMLVELFLWETSWSTS